MRKCFTINPYRNTEDFKSYYPLVENRFFPYTLSEEGIKVYKQNADKFVKMNAEMVLHLPHGKENDLCDFDNFNLVFTRMKDAITFGKDLNVGKYTLHLGFSNNGSRNKLITHLVKVVSQLCDYAGNALIMIENMPGESEMGYSPEEIEEIIVKVNKPNVKFILDTGHANVSDYVIDNYITKLFPYLSHIHLSDNKGKRDEHAPLGTGNIDFKNVFKLLESYEGLYCLEVLYKDVNDLLANSKILDSYF